MTKLSLKTKIKFDPSENRLWIGFSYKNEVYNPIQLKNDSILVYTKHDISILGKNFKKKELMSFSYAGEKNSPEISKVKQIKNGKILCCATNLHIFEFKSNNVVNTKNIKFPEEEKIYDVIELKNGKLLGISNKSIFEIKSEEENYNFSILFQIPNNWLITAYSKQERFFSNFRQYIDMYELPNNRLLIHSHSTELSHNGGCGTHPPYEVCFNRIYIINLEKFEIIHSFDEIGSEINIIFFEKYFAISYTGKNQYNKIIDIYDINDYKLVKEIEDQFEKNYIIKYDNNTFIAMNKNEKRNDIIVYDISDINDIKFKILEGNFMKFQKKVYNSCYPVRYSKNKTFCVLNNRDILIICHGLIYIVNFPGSLNILDFAPLKEMNIPRNIYSHYYYDDD